MHPIIRDVQKKQLKPLPEVRPGYTIKVHQKIKEGNKERVQVFEGLVIKTSHGEGVEKTITVRKIVQGIGVEKVFPLHSPNIKKIEVKKKAKVRRSKLYYMRERSGKSARLQERHVTDAERAEEGAKMEALIQEAVKADEKRKAEEAKAEGETPTDTVETEHAPSQEEKKEEEKTDKPIEAEGEAEASPVQGETIEPAEGGEPVEPAEEPKEEEAEEKPKE